MTDAPTPRDVAAADMMDCGFAENDAYASADSILSALTAAGYVVVPREPTRDMLRAGWVAANKDDGCSGDEEHGCIYCDALEWNGGGCRGMAAAAYRAMIAEWEKP